MNYINAECECGHQRHLHKVNFNYSSLPDDDKREIPCRCVGISLVPQQSTSGILKLAYAPFCKCDDFRETFDSAVSRLRDDRKNDKV